jgi:hypothetical protein
MQAAAEGAKRGEAARRAQGSMQDRLDRARRSQGEEASERMPPRMSRNAKGGNVMKKYAKGGGIESRGKTKGTEVKMASGGKCYAKGGSIDGCATKGKTKGKMV